MPSYFRNILLNFTQLLGSFTGITLNANETTSGAVFRRDPDGWARRLIDKIFFWQESHCARAVDNEIEDCKELLLAYGFDITPPPVTKIEAVRALGEDSVSSRAFRKLWEKQAPARTQEDPGNRDPMGDDFDAPAWFAQLPNEAKQRIVEWGVSIKMSKANREKVRLLAEEWHIAQGGPARSDHGMKRP